MGEGKKGKAKTRFIGFIGIILLLFSIGGFIAFGVYKNTRDSIDIDNDFIHSGFTSAMTITLTWGIVFLFFSLICFYYYFTSISRINKINKINK